jgi:hypothetical protein
MRKKIRAIAFYLPQFYPTIENDEWWGKGFTEWTNVASARPLFKGHYQPHIPADLGFYDLRLQETRVAQAELARSYGIEGFCYYHYWFGSRRMLERPFGEVLSTGKPDFPFCLCWANHSWNSVWQGCPDRLLIEQTYPGMDDHERHFSYLLKAFFDTRYLRVNNKPIFLIYKPRDLPDIRRVTEFWRELAVKAGLPGLYLVGVSHNEGWDPDKLGLDAVAFQRLPKIDGTISWHYPGAKIRSWLSRRKYNLTIYRYEDAIRSMLRPRRVKWRDFPTVHPNWDNTPRAGMNGLVFHGSTPGLFREHLHEAVEKVKEYPEQEKIVFIKAWNEWAEGNYLEPDREFGTAYLEEIAAEISSV